MVTAKSILNKARKFIEISKININKLLTNPKVRQWDDVDFDILFSAINNLGLSAVNLQQTVVGCQKTAARALKEIEQQENEMGCLELDISHKSVTLRQAEARAENIRKLQIIPEHSIKTLFGYGKLLLDADHYLCSLLTLSGMLQFLKDDPRYCAKRLNQGYDFYLFVISDKAEDNNGKNIVVLLNEAIRQEKLLNSIDLSDLPGMARIIVEHQTQQALTVAGQIKQNIIEFKDNLPQEFDVIQQCRTNLQSLKEADLTSVIRNTHSVKQSLGDSMVALHDNTYYLYKFKLISLMLNNLYIFQKTVKNDLLPDLIVQLNSTFSPLNFSHVAVHQADNFFTGLTGMIRSLKLIFSIQSLNRITLQNTMITILQTCDIYYGKTEVDVRLMKKFIDNSLTSCSRPFPYEELFKLMKNMLQIYGTRMEKYYDSYKIKTSLYIDNGVSTKNRAATLGDLLNKIKTEVITLQEL